MNFSKMISGATSCFPNVSQGLEMYENIPQEGVPSSLEQTSTWESHSNSLLYTLSLLKEKVHQVESLVTIFISTNQAQPTKSTAMAIANMGALVQEVMVTASSLMFTYQQMSTPANTIATATSSQPNLGGREEQPGQGFFNSGESTLDQWYACDPNTNQTNINVSNRNGSGRREKERESTKIGHENNPGSPKNYDIIELDAADLLAKYTHYCQVCGKGFKRDANLRMHMRAHGDEYKSSAALSNPMKNSNINISSTASCDDEGEKDGGTMMLPRKYSCPHEGCRWNRKHAKFQPLKSMICVKNHYKRSHCPKMYVCKRCNRKQFSVLSDLRTHEKHCGDLKWVCSCGTTFSRKDKLMGHCALFVGHTPATPPPCGGATAMKVMGKVEQQQQRDQVQIRVNNR